MFESVSDLDEKFDIVTFFHVFKYLDNPIEYLRELKQAFRDGGRLLIEVPHAKDALIQFCDYKEFQEFTF